MSLLITSTIRSLILLNWRSVIGQTTQLHLVIILISRNKLSSNYGKECCFASEPGKRSYHYNNGYFEAVDAEMAYCMVRHFKPSRIVEIGTG
jgi:hypothetical protein